MAKRAKGQAGELFIKTGGRPRKIPKTIPEDLLQFDFQSEKGIREAIQAYAGLVQTGNLDHNIGRVLNQMCNSMLVSLKQERAGRAPEKADDRSPEQRKAEVRAKVLDLLGVHTGGACTVGLANVQEDGPEEEQKQ